VSWEGTQPEGSLDPERCPPSAPPVTADLRLFAREDSGCLVLELAYDPALFDRERATELIDILVAELAELSLRPDRDLTRPPITPADDGTELASSNRNSWGDTQYGF
jgi:hypothetical protein